jgi:hypothetical protein
VLDLVFCSLLQLLFAYLISIFWSFQPYSYLVICLVSFGMQGKVQLLSAEAIHELHIFIFVLAVTHFLLSAVTVLLGMVQVYQLNRKLDVYY